MTGSCEAAREGSLERDRMTDGMTSPPGERSKRSARALTLLETCGGERDEATDEAGPETERGVVLVGERSLLEPAVFWRWRVTCMSGEGAGTGAGAASCAGV